MCEIAELEELRVSHHQVCHEGFRREKLEHCSEHFFYFSVVKFIKYEVIY